MQVAPLSHYWKYAPGTWCLAENEVHVWRTSLARTFDEYEQLRAFLAEDERDQARSFSSHEKCRQWVVTRGTLRFLLGTYLNIHPAHVVLHYDAYGKPGLGEAWRHEQIHFNLAHSEGLATYAFARKRQLGIDIEYMRASTNYMLLARRKFAAGEYETLQQLPPEEQRRAFFTCWARKEAYLKARGEGIAYGLNSFEVSLRPGELGVLLKNFRDPLECQRWLMKDVVPGNGYVGALLVERKRSNPIFHHYTLTGWDTPTEKEGMLLCS